MFIPHLFKTTRTILDRVLGWSLSDEVPMPDGMERSPDSQQDFLDRVRRIFAERGYREVEGESALDEQFLLFARNDALHLVYCLPYETYVTTSEIQTGWETQCSLGAHSSSVAAPHRFSQAAIHKAQSLAIELLPVESG